MAIASILANVLRANTLSGQTTISLTRGMISILGGLMLGDALFANNDIGAWWQIILGLVLVIIGTVMSMLDKMVDIEKFQGMVRHVIKVIGGIFVGAGSISDADYDIWLGVALSVIPFIQGWMSRKKVQKVASGEIDAMSLKGANDKNLK